MAAKKRSSRKLGPYKVRKKTGYAPTGTEKKRPGATVTEPRKPPKKK